LASKCPVSGACESASQIGRDIVKIAITIVRVTAKAENTASVRGVTAGDVRLSPFGAMMDP
jgi:hypothetical protein